MQGTSAIHGDHFSWVPMYHLRENNKIWDFFKNPSEINLLVNTNKQQVYLKRNLRSNVLPKQLRAIHLNQLN